MNTINETNFKFPDQKSVYKGKVREVYNINDKLLVDDCFLIGLFRLWMVVWPPPNSI